MLYALIAIVAVLADSVPPLSAQQRERLSRAADGADHRDDAFAAVLENVTQWPNDVARVETPAFSRPDVQVMIENPAMHRGELFLLRGTIQQQIRLPPPYEHVHECFVRDSAGNPLLVYVVAMQSGDDLRAGHTLRIEARFYKRVDFVTHGGKMQQYAAFVGAWPLVTATALPSGTKGESQRPWLLASLVILMLFVFAGLMIFTRTRPRTGGVRASRPHVATPFINPVRPISNGDTLELDGDANLPDDPAEALAELHRRAQ